MLEVTQEKVLKGQDYLTHHGVKGQKWGVIRPKEVLDRLAGRTSKSKKEDVKKMSDQELRQKINRIQMEKQYSKLTSRQMSAGEKAVRDVLANSAKNVATNYTTKAMTKAVEEIIKRASKR